MNNEITATCQCGAVRFRSQHQPVLQQFCHCKDCPVSTSGAFAKTAFFKLKYTEVSGRLAVRTFKADSGNKTTRESCAHCGSLMFDRSEGFASLIGVMAERINESFVFEPACHVWTKSKQSHVTIPDDVKQYVENITP